MERNEKAEKTGSKIDVLSSNQRLHLMNVTYQCIGIVLSLHRTHLTHSVNLAAQESSAYYMSV